ncbi:placenta-specific gene 8 protein-like [Engraulis encrasicolus]|uniref:placenta-specific gene 8 protein-like n=1 Tax=Engraulis encrasicolus TaxID=184585 RepID=UPI002FD1675D
MAVVQTQVSTTVTVGPVAPPPAPKPGNWSTGLFDCCADMSSCCFAFWCFPCMQCQTTGKHGWCCAMPLLDPPSCLAVTCCIRKSVRHKFNIEGSVCKDIWATLCCYMCVWCQMSRELKTQD